MANRLLVLYVRENNLGLNRLGISISKKVGGAVTRNRIKRLIKEQIRALQKNLALGYDLVFIARAPAADASFADIGKSLSNLLARQKIL